jgi:hypothetical protein
MTTKFSVLNKTDKSVPYEIIRTETSDGRLWELWTTDSSEWSQHYRSIKLLSVFDNGNGLKFLNKISKKQEYHEFIQLSILCSCILKLDSSLSEDYEIIHQTLTLPL